MARGAEAKLRKKSEKKEARAAEATRLLEEKDSGTLQDNSEDPFPMPPGMSENGEVDGNASAEPNTVSKQKKKKKKSPSSSTTSNAERSPSSGSTKKIKPLPLIMLLLLTGSAILPALIYTSEWMGNMVQKHHIMGSLGHKLGIGATPKKRVMSFYEKHEPEKLADVPHIMSKYYGDYPLLVKRLERRYQDYGYFKSWEEDEAPMKLAMEKFKESSNEVGKLWLKHAPSFIQTGVRNARNNFKFLYKKGRKIWKKKVWPVLEPFLGVPEESPDDKKKRRDSRKKKKKGKSAYRDDEEF